MIFKDEFSPKNILLDVLYSIFGSAMVGIAISMFTVPNDIAPGGVSGLATALAYVIPVKVSMWTLLLNIPLLIAAWRNLGRHTLVYTLISSLLLSLFIELTELYLPKYNNNVLIAAVFGGALSGLGIGVLFLRNISTGGTDLAALLLKKLFPNIANGTLLLFADGAVVVIAVCIFRNIEVALTSAITIYIGSKVIDAVAQGVDYAKVVYVITDKGQEIADLLMQKTERGVTLVDATGAYTGDSKQMLVTVTKRNLLSQTLRMIKEADPAAFTFVSDSTEVHGLGFKEEGLKPYIPETDRFSEMYK